MNSFNPFTLFEHLLDGFVKLQEVSRRFVPSDGNTDLFVTMAAVGFAQYAPEKEWRNEYSQQILSLREGDYSNTNLEWYEDGAESIAAFACLAFGAMFGLFQTKQINEAAFQNATALLPGFLALNNTKIDACWLLQ